MKKYAAAALSTALAAGVILSASPAHAAGAKCEVRLSVPAYVAQEVQPQATVTLAHCGSGRGQLQVKRSGSSSPTKRDLGTLRDGTHTSFVGDVHAGSYTVRAVVDGASSPWKPMRVVAWPTVDHAAWKFVEQPTYAWGKFDVDRPIKVYTEVWLGNRWSRSQTVTTDASGRYKVPLTYGAGTAGTYTYRVTGAYPSGMKLNTQDFVLERVALPTAASAGVKEVGVATNAWGRLDVFEPTTAWTEVWLGNRWSRSQTRTTKANGQFAIPLTYGANSSGVTKWRVGGIIEGQTVYSKEFFLQRVQRLTAATAGRKPVGQTTYAWGKADTSKPLTVWTEVWIGNRWSRSQTTTTDTNGRYTLPLTYGANTPGTYKYRVAAKYPYGVLRSDEVTIQRVR